MREMEKGKKKRIYSYGLFIILVTILLLGISYAWLTLTLNGTKTNVLKSGTLSLILDETMGEGIRVDSAVPMYDSTGMRQTPYRFSLKNDGTLDSEYTIYLDDLALGEGQTRAPDSAFKYNLTKDNQMASRDLLSILGVNPNRVLDAGKIKAGQTINYELRLWVDENVTSDLTGQRFFGTLRVEAMQVIPKEPTDESCFVLDETGTIIEQYICGPNIVDATDTVVENTNSINNMVDVVIPKTIKGKTITQIGYSTEKLEELCGSLSTTEEITACKSGKYAFSQTGITNIEIPDSITSIGVYSFFQNQLTSIEIPNSVTTISDFAFRTNHLTSVIIPKNISVLEMGVFTDNQLTSVEIPASVTSIETGAFYQNALRSVILPEGLVSIQKNAFRENNLNSITIPASVMEIQNYAFTTNSFKSVIIKGKSSTADFASFGTNVFGWSSGFSNSNITWNG